MIRSARARAVLRVVGVVVVAVAAVLMAGLLPVAIDSSPAVTWIYLSAAVVVLADALVAGANLHAAGDGDRARTLARAAWWIGVALLASLAAGAWVLIAGGVPADEAGYAAFLLAVPAAFTSLLAAQTRQDTA